MGNSSGSETYYTSLAKEDYYLEGGEPAGTWLGKGAAALALSGTVDDQSFKHLFRGYSREGEGKLVQNAGASSRRPGYDLTFSAPKSVSVFWSQADAPTRQIVQQAQQKAVETALNYLEEQTITRMGKGGHHHVPAKLVVATFEHGTSRAQDPQLHTHALVLNVAVRPDGSTGTIENNSLYRNKMLAGAIYRAELAKELQQQLGLRAEKVKSWFEIKGVDQGLIEEFSKRRQAIEEYLEKNNLKSAKAAEVAALKTREVKGHVARSDLFKQWQGVGAEYGYEQPIPQYFIAAEDTSLNICQKAIADIMENNAHFTQRELLTKAAMEATPHALSWQEIQEGVAETLNQSEIVTLDADERSDVRYTTQEMLAIEAKLLDQATSSKSRQSHFCKQQVLDKAIAKRTLSEEQEKALQHLIDSRGSIKIISGMAGTGKSYLLDAAREVWEGNNYQVLGAAFTGKAASSLAQDANLKTSTLHSLLWSVEQGKITLDAKTVLVVDEAGMVGTRQLGQLIDRSVSSGSKLILVGDHRQLQPIGAGGAKKKLMENLGYVQLSNIKRQEEEWAREAVKNLADGKAEKSLTEHLKRGLVHIAETAGTAKDKLIDDWTKYGVKKPGEHLILAAYRDDVFHLNRLAQLNRQDAGLLGKDSIRVKGQKMYVGDRIVFTRNCRHNGVKNGQFGTVKGIKSKKITVKLDDGSQKTLNTRTYDHIQLGYASTTHKAQGETRHHAYVLVGGDMQDLEMSYVQLSRAKYKTRIYVEPWEEPGQTLQQLIAEMKRSRQKQMAVYFYKDII